MSAHALIRLATPWVCLAALAGPAAAAGLPLVNGSFESPGAVGYAELGAGSNYLTGWTTVLSGVEYFNATPWGGAADGLMAVDLANYVYASGGLEQAVATVAGQTYELSFSTGNHAYAGRSGTGIVQVSVDGQASLRFDTPSVASATIAWATHGFSFVASSASTTLRFWNDQNPYAHFAYLDGVGVQAAVPEPGRWVLMAAGLLAIAGLARRRKPGR